LIGGQMTVDAAVILADAIGVPEVIVGLFLLAVGTSLPELAVSATAAFKGKTDIAIGNVVGSNIFNSLLCLGAAGLAGSVSASLRGLSVELAVLALMTLLTAAAMRTRHTISRLHGGAALVLYGTFMVVAAIRG
jgi:cation:H+ antiporter